VDNLRLGRDVVGDCINDMVLTRNGWRSAGLRAGAEIIEVEIVCTDPIEHRRRVETRATEFPDVILPGWEAVAGRAYEPWDRGHLTIDTAGNSIDTCVQLVLAAF
jgi:hypothetical protein